MQEDVEHDGQLGLWQLGLALAEGLGHRQLQHVHLVSVVGVSSRVHHQALGADIQQGIDSFHATWVFRVQACEDIRPRRLNELNPIVGGEGASVREDFDVAPDPCGLSSQRPAAGIQPGTGFLSRQV